MTATRRNHWHPPPERRRPDPLAAARPSWNFGNQQNSTEDNRSRLESQYRKRPLFGALVAESLCRSATGPQPLRPWQIGEMVQSYDFGELPFLASAT